MNGDADSSRSWAWTLAAIVAGGAVLRLAGIGAESVDLEEYACTGALHTRGLHQFLIEQRALYPYGAPLAPLLFYLWSGLFGTGIAAVRLLSALAGTALILMLALLAREIWPDSPRKARIAGLIAALCAAMSPAHLFQAQEARMYAFVALFAALSSLSLLRAARTGRRRWWAVNLAANAALVWSHYFAVFLWPVQALWLLFTPGVRWRTLLFWLGAQGLLLLPVVVWMSGIAPQPQELHDYYTMPGLALIVRNLIAGDAVHWSSSAYFPSGRAWFFAPEVVRRAVVAAHPFADTLIAGAFSAALLWGVLRLFKRLPARVARTGYLVLWAVVPPALMVALSFAWKPVYASRYLTHASLALYLLLGGLMAWLPGRVRALCVALLITVYAWQLSLALPPQTRTDWKQAGRMIEAADGVRAITLVQGVFWKPIFEANLPSQDRSVTAVLEPEAMAEMAVFLAGAISAVEPGANPSCWAVLVDAIHGQAGRFESAAAPRGVLLERTEFPGERVLELFRIASPPGAARGTVETAPPALLDVARAMADHPADPAIAAFQEAMRTRSDQEGGGYLRLGVDLARRGRVELAAAVLDEALARFPAHLVDLVLLQRGLSGQGDFAPLAEHALGRIKNAPERVPVLRQVLQSLLERGQFDELRDIAGRMIRAFPDYSQGYAYLGRQYYDDGRGGDALPNLERAVALDPVQLGCIYHALGDTYLRMGRCSDALRVLEQGYPHDPLDAMLAFRLAEAHVECGDAGRALALVAERLKQTPQADDLLCLRVEALMRLGKWDEAEAEMGLLLERIPADPQFNLLMWRILSHGRRDAEAGGALRKIAEGDPNIRAVINPLIDALYVRHDRAAAMESYGKLSGGAPLPASLLETLDRLCPGGQPPAGAGSSSQATSPSER
jgi:tetratricopeptide (TPR) repeat protein/4-amino-4-deoxy-L-arabinose transferase-like glycosyltransferase